MERDVMVIRRKDPSKPDLVVDGDNQVKELPGCPVHRKYKGLRKPVNNCTLCWASWHIKEAAKTGN